MKIRVNDYDVCVTDTVNMPELIKTNFEMAYLEGRADEPFYVCDLGDIVRKHKLWIRKFPRVEAYYAMKCNPTPLIVSILSTLGLGFDCASKEEINQALNSGVPAHKIIFANPAKQSSHLLYASNNKVKLMTFDCVEELRKIKANHNEAELVLRVFVGTDKALCPLGKKFGAFPNEIYNIFEQASSMSMNIVGLSFHVGSGCFDPSAYSIAIKFCREVFDIGTSFGFKMDILDIGGGFPGNLHSDDEIFFFESVCDAINESLDEHFPVSTGIRIIAEPGRYYVSSAFDLACTVTSVRAMQNQDMSDVSYSYFLNDGVYGSFNCTHFDHYIGKHYLLDSSDIDRQEEFLSTFWGPTCDSMDKILENFFIPKLKVGTCVAFKSMGAYTMAAGSCFNGFPRPYINYYSGKAEWAVIAGLLESDVLSEGKIRLSLSDEELTSNVETSSIFLTEISDVI